MSDSRSLVIDANVILRAVFGGKARDLIDSYLEVVDFCSPEICFEDARRHIPVVAAKRAMDPIAVFRSLDRFVQIVEIVDDSSYQEQESEARNRIDYRDPDDWPILATALLLACPIWTEDQDFFGTGVATWNTRNVKLYLEGD